MKIFPLNDQGEFDFPAFGIGWSLMAGDGQLKLVFETGESSAFVPTIGAGVVANVERFSVDILGFAEFGK